MVAVVLICNLAVFHKICKNQRLLLVAIEIVEFVNHVSISESGGSAFSLLEVQKWRLDPKVQRIDPVDAWRVVRNRGISVNSVGWVVCTHAVSLI